MPHYHFNVHSHNRRHDDEEGSTFPDDDAARHHALQVVRDLTRNDNKAGWILEIMEGGRRVWQIALSV